MMNPAKAHGHADPGGPKPKRQRTAHACFQCNKSKAKCEVADDGGQKCRRCVRLFLPCAFLGPDRPAKAGCRDSDPYAAYSPSHHPNAQAQQTYGASHSTPLPNSSPAPGLGGGGGGTFGEARECSTDGCLPGAQNEGAMAARRLASVLAIPGVDANLDCERGIMRALTEHNTAASDVPLELLREWTLVAVQRRDCGLLGRAMTLAAAGGHSMETLLDSVGTLSTVLHEITGLFQAAVVQAAAASCPPGTAPPPVTPYGGGHCSVLSASHGSMAALPACMAWVDDGGVGGRSAQLVLIKQVVNGRVTFTPNKAFETYVIGREFLQASWAAKGRPSTELFLHPDDAPVVCAFVGRLWKGLQPLDASRRRAVAPGAVVQEKECGRDLPAHVRVWVTKPQHGYVRCAGKVQLVVSKRTDGQASSMVFAFRPAVLVASGGGNGGNGGNGGENSGAAGESSGEPPLPSDAPAGPVALTPAPPRSLVADKAPPGHAASTSAGASCAPAPLPRQPRVDSLVPAVPAGEPPAMDDLLLSDDFWSAVTDLAEGQFDGLQFLA